MSVIRIFRTDNEFESHRFVTDNNGDIEIRPENGGRFTVHRKTGGHDPESGKPYYQLIGNYNWEWSYELLDQVRFTP